MPGIGPIRNSAPIKQAAAKQELEAVRHQLSRFKNDVQVRLLVSESGRLQVSRVSGRAPEQDPDEKAQASQRLLDLLRTQGENPDGQLLGERLSRNQLITLIDRYHKPPASGRSFHGANPHLHHHLHAHVDVIILWQGKPLLEGRIKSR